MADGADEVEGVAGAAAEEAHELRELEAPQQRPVVYGVELPGAGRAERGLRSALASGPPLSDRLGSLRPNLGGGVRIVDQWVSPNAVGISGLVGDHCWRT